MSIAPPRGPEIERGSAETEAGSFPAEAPAAAQPRGGSASSSSPGGSDEASLWRDEQIALFEAEARLDEVANPSRAARLLHEVARLCEQRPGGAREAARLYTVSLSSDPTLQANTWALFRLFSARESWENVLRLIDAEARFAQLPTAADRADLLLEKGRILEDRLGRDEEAMVAFRAALAAAPGHPGALLALLLLGVSSRDLGAIDEALAGLSVSVQDPQLRALFVVERARQQRGSLQPDLADGLADRIRLAADTLFHGLSAAAAEDPLCEELDRLSLLSDDPDLRSRVLDAFDARFGHEDASRHDPALLVAVHREKARLLCARGARDGALAVLERGLRFLPRHPLLVADLIDLADEAGRPDAIAAVEQGGHLEPGEPTEQVAMRRAEAAARNGAYGEAMGILGGLSADGPVAPLAELLRTRVLARTGDLEGLAEAFVATADRLCGDGQADAAAKREAAHLLVRAAVLRGMGTRAAREGTDVTEVTDLGKKLSPEALLARALELAPHFAPAREAQRAGAIRRGDAAGLGALYEEEARVESEPDRRAALLRSAFLIQRDLVRDPAATARLSAHAPVMDELTRAVRALDEAGLRAAGGVDATEMVVPALRQLIDQVGEGPAAAGLALLGARLATAAGQTQLGLEFARKAFASDPAGGAAPLLEEHHRRASQPAEVLDVLSAELRAALAAAPDEMRDDLRALRFRLALTAAEAGRAGEALQTLAPLRAQSDRSALVWSLELARGANDPALEAALLREPAVVAIASTLESAAPGGPDAGQALCHGRLALAEAQLDSAGGGAGAAGAAAVNEALATLADLPSPSGASPLLTAELALLRLRIATHLASGAPALVAAWGDLADALAGTAVGGDLRQDADLLALAAGSALGPGPQAPGDSALAALGAFVTGVRTGDRAAQLAGLEQLALRSGAGAPAAALQAQLGLRQILAGQSHAAAANFVRALAERSPPSALPTSSVSSSALAEVMVSDLAPELISDPGAAAAWPALQGTRVARAERLAAAGGASAAVAAALYAESAAVDESRGRLAAAASSYARMIDLDPSALEAVLGLERTARLGGDRRGQAAALLRLGSLLRDPRAAAARVAEAARLFDQDGLGEDAGAAFTQVLRLVPGDDPAYQRLHDILVEREDAAALERLLSFKLAHTQDPQARVAFYGERAALRLDRLDRREDGIADHRRIVALDPGNLASLRTLARLARAAECPEIAARFMVQALPHATGDVAHQLRLDLAATYLACDDEESAIEVLQTVASERPADKEARERLVDVGMRHRRWDLVAEQFRALGAHAETDADRSAWIVRLGRLERDQRRDLAQAQTAFREALRLDPLGEAAREFCATLGEVPLDPADGPLVNEAVTALRGSIQRSPLAPRRLESLSALARAAGLTDLSEAAAQLLALLGGPPSRGRSRGIVRSLALDSFAPAVPSPQVGRALELWPLLAGPLAELAGLDPAALGTNRATRLAPGSEPRLAWADAASVGLGLSSLVIHIAGVDDLGVAAFDAPEPCLVVGRGVPGGDAGVRFRVGRALTLLAQQAALCDAVSFEDLERDWAAAVLLVTERADPRFDAGSLRARAKALGKIMSRKERKALEERIAAGAPGGFDVAGWWARVHATANRGGLLVSGDLGMTLRWISARDNGQGNAAANPSPADLESEACRDVLQFAFGDRFAALREAVRQRDRINTGEHGGR